MPPTNRRSVRIQAARARRTNAWDEESIRHALEELLRGHTEWPTYRWFVRHDAKTLRDAVTRHGGAERWARELGLASGDRGRGGSTRWTDEWIRSVLTPFLAGRSAWPTRSEFDQAGLAGLREALRLQDSVDRWAEEFGLPRRRRTPNTQRRRVRPPEQRARKPHWPFWTDERIHTELARFFAGRSDWPRFAEFVAAGKKGLYQAVLAHGGSQVWAGKMGVVRLDRQAPVWTEDRIRERLSSFLAGREQWPTEADFAAAGEAPLLNAARKLGGSRRWAEEFGFAASLNEQWSDFRIAREIGPLVRELGRWPTKAEFRRAGLSKALAAVYTHGGSERWRERFGVQPLSPTGPVPDRRIWTPARIEQELREFVAGRDRWPAQRVFEEADRRGLYHAAWQHGGIAYWRRRLKFD